ncbi:hypothetical protein [uncultured Clostridium sp.]|jgi:hypothetical protein|uniref:hypothetical protein n=1 Tax=uncultured Clostridium sp. TaxID=59620 RepID=UPI002609507E|nr:hypothetical protein [uncultured Clostridium sp.]
MNDYKKITNQEYLNESNELKRHIDLSVANQKKLDSAQALYDNGQYAESKKALDELLNCEIPLLNQLCEISELQKLANSQIKPEHSNESFTYDVALGYLHNCLGSKANDYNFEFFQEDSFNGIKQIYISSSGKNDPPNGMIYRVDIKGNIREAG